jgi:hypothetical protein
MHLELLDLQQEIYSSTFKAVNLRNRFTAVDLQQQIYSSRFTAADLQQ